MGFTEHIPGDGHWLSISQTPSHFILKTSPGGILNLLMRNQGQVAQGHTARGSELDSESRCLFIIEVYLIYYITLVSGTQHVGLPRWLSGEEPSCNAGAAGDAGSIPPSGRFPRRRHANLLH